MRNILLGLNLLCMVGIGHADISWGVNANPVLGPDDVTLRDPAQPMNTPLTGSDLDPAAGFMVQLILDVAGDGINPIPAMVPAGFQNDPQYGAQTGDMVVATRWMGAGFVGPGKFSAALYNEPATPGAYFIRTWGGISQDPAVVGTTDPDARIPLPYNDGVRDFWWYGDSEIFNSPGDGSGPPAINFIDFTASGGFAADNLIQAVAVPEPASLILLGIGLVLLGASRTRIR